MTLRGRPFPPEKDHLPASTCVVRIAERHFGLPDGSLSGNKRSRLDSWHRCLLCTLAVSWLGYPNKKVTTHLGKGRDSVSRWLAEGHRLQRTDPDFRERLHTLRALVGPIDDSWTAGADLRNNFGELGERGTLIDLGGEQTADGDVLSCELSPNTSSQRRHRRRCFSLNST